MSKSSFLMMMGFFICRGFDEKRSKSKSIFLCNRLNLNVGRKLPLKNGNCMQKTCHINTVFFHLVHFTICKNVLYYSILKSRFTTKATLYSSKTLQEIVSLSSSSHQVFFFPCDFGLTHPARSPNLLLMVCHLVMLTQTKLEIGQGWQAY